MNSVTRIPLPTTPGQTASLLALQAAFAEVCNVLSPVVAQQRCWNRVALHHLMYRKLREQFPALGSQMVCNAIFMVCKMGRLVYQGADSPFNVARMGEQLLPTLRFNTDCPVHFDSHTLSMKSGTLSIFTMGGRLRFAIRLRPAQIVLFASRRVLEITLYQRPDGVHELSFFFEAVVTPAAPAMPVAPEPAVRLVSVRPSVRVAALAKKSHAVSAMPRWPDYLQVEAAS